MTEDLFVYGTLKLPEVQSAVIGREVELKIDVLKGYSTTPVHVNGNQHLALVTDENSEIEGAVISVTNEELERIDSYEPEEYKKIGVTTENGNRAWVYVRA